MYGQCVDNLWTFERFMLLSFERKTLLRESPILIGTVYRNSSSSTNSNYLSFQIFPRRSCEPQVQECACPAWTYACLAKHHSK